MHPKPNPGSWRKNSHIHRGSLGDFYQINLGYLKMIEVNI